MSGNKPRHRLKPAVMAIVVVNSLLIFICDFVSLYSLFLSLLPIYVFSAYYHTFFLNRWRWYVCQGFICVFFYHLTYNKYMIWLFEIQIVLYHNYPGVVLLYLFIRQQRFLQLKALILLQLLVDPLPPILHIMNMYDEFHSLYSNLSIL